MPDDFMTATADGEVDSEVQQNSTIQVDNGDTGHAEQPTEKTFTQAQLDEIVKGRLEKERQRIEGQYKSDPRLSFVESQAKRYGMTTEQYLDAVKQAEEQEKVNELIQKNIPEEYAKEMLENRNFRETYQTEKQAREAQEKRQKEYGDFFDWYSKTYGKEVDPKSIPPDVWQATKNGISLKTAYMEYAFNGYRSRELEADKVNLTQQANERNAGSSTGPVKNNIKPTSKDPFEIGFNSVK